MSTSKDSKSDSVHNKQEWDLLFEDLALRRSLSANLVSFCSYLRKNGLGLGLGEQMDALRALEKVNIEQGIAFRMALRTTLAKSIQEQEIFDEHYQHFWHVWDSAENLHERYKAKKEEPAAVVIDARPHKQTFVSINDWLGGAEKAEVEKEAAGYSPFETEDERDFSTFQAEELAVVMQLINEAGKALATRFSRRTLNAKKRGLIDLRRTMRLSLRRGGEILDLAFKQRRRQRLKLVLLCDVSKSMDLYSRFLIQFIYAFQSVYRRIETFVFSTSLHQITETLRKEELYTALAQLSRTVPDWSGGTKIGASLGQFVSQHGLKLVDSQTVVLIISDGWDTGEVDLLENNMRFLQKHARKVIWLNPLKGSSGYEPTTRGMQAALPFIDIFASAHNLNSLRKLVSHLSRIQHGQSGRSSAVS
ncbi:MAG: VWA domain-containing protein [SAR324 cluster bacterium]|nr:VWA domain-containing protein [SAR324 cluster bacterium]MBL7036045.1 VWA domain-containing protein [SAR324 cluster bacterium]